MDCESSMVRLRASPVTPGFGPVAQRTGAALSEGAGHRFKSDQGLHAGVAQWQSASPVRTKPAFDSRRRLHAGGIRAAEYLTLNQRSASSSLAARTRICPVSSDGRAPVLQTGSRRLEPSTGYQIWGRRLIGRTPVLQTGNEGSSPSASTKLGGHGSVAESDIASVGARVRFPLTAPRGVGIWGVPRPSKPKKRIRFPHAAPDFRDVG